MTRINTVPPEELHYSHLVAEYRELPRVFSLARKSQFEYLRGKYVVPKEYTLGTGHMRFFVPRLKFLADRYESLVAEMQRRGYKPNPIPRNELLDKIDPRLHNDYIPTQEAIAINLERINLRLKGK